MFLLTLLQLCQWVSRMWNLSFEHLGEVSLFWFLVWLYSWLIDGVRLPNQCKSVGVICSSVERISGAHEELRVRPGDDVTLLCDIEDKNLWAVEWRRNCSHRNQPTLVLEGRWTPPRITFQKSTSSNSMDLRIKNITEHDLGLYYCQDVKTQRQGNTINLLFEGK